jgi:hypothetical protein
MKVIVGLQFCLYVQMSDNSEMLLAVHSFHDFPQQTEKLLIK